MSNNLLTISMITNEALMVLENELTFSSEVATTMINSPLLAQRSVQP